MDILNSYKKELSEINKSIVSASEEELFLLLDRRSQLIGKISELTLQHEVRDNDRPDKDAQGRVISV